MEMNCERKDRWGVADALNGRLLTDVRWEKIRLCFPTERAGGRPPANDHKVSKGIS